MEKPSAVLRVAAETAIAKSGKSVRRFEVECGLKPYALRGVTDRGRPQVPSLDRAAELCDALGLELYVGPPREASENGKQPLVFHTSPPNPAPDSGLVGLLARVADGWESLDSAACGRLEKAVDADLELAGAARRGRFRPLLNRLLLEAPHLALAPLSEDGGESPNGRPIGMHELETAAGGGAVDIDEAPFKGNVWFRREWLDRHGLDPNQCVVIGVRGKSMEPTLIDGCSILVARDERRHRLRAGRVYVLLTEDGLVVKRAGREDGKWMLLSDAGPPDWPTTTWPRDAEVKGEVIWTARTLVPTSS